MVTSQPEHNALDSSLPPDPLSKLHKMSTTAGVASQQYVAVNIAAVIAVLLGVASTMSIFSPLLLVIPIIGVVVSITAWRQISNSNGTETGKIFAASGLILSLLLGGGVIGKEALEQARLREDGRQMDHVAHQLNDAVRAQKYEVAHALFDVEFRTRVPLDLFKTRWELMQKPEAYGTLQSMAWNDVLPQYEKIEGGTGELGVNTIVVKFDRSEGRFTFVYRKVGDDWKIVGVPELFPADRPAKKQ